MSGFSSEHAEEQALECEALEAIYMEVSECTGDNPIAWKVHLKPHPDGVSHTHLKGEENFVEVDMCCCMPERYPDEVPSIAIEGAKGLNQKLLEELCAVAHGTAKDNVGMAMGYTLAEAVREWLVDHNVAGQDGSMHADMLRRMADNSNKNKAAAEIEANQEEEDDEEDEETLRKRRQAEGTVVSPESFAEWNAGFMKEMAQVLAKGQGKASSARPVAEGKDLGPTGKQMFLQHLTGTTEEEAVAEEAGDLEMEVDVGNEDLFLGGSDDEDLVSNPPNASMKKEKIPN
ncbi:unnamed protein product [Chrysoparadoxa australica]